MFQYVVYCFGIFFLVLEILLVVFLIQSFFRVNPRLRAFFIMLVYPILAPMQRLFKYSILNTFSIDLSPYIALIILDYLRILCDYLTSG